MELPLKKKKWRSHSKLPTVTGFLSFLLALIILVAGNIYFLTQSKLFLGLFFSKMPLIGLLLGIAGLFTKKHSRLYAIWGIGLHAFILVYYVLMIVFQLSINYVP
ncbi:hypothetical protein [Bacillus sp. 1P06AnD]|uniref:hypothetical protein n=1 Tax=Bacillus sp. 1P06AnD TaxID=3132208 RepID=UPI0039A0FBB5